MVGVLFVMTIDRTRSSITFASVADVGYFEAKEEEVFFSMHTIFRIEEITSMHGSSRHFQVEVDLVSDQDNDLHQ